MHYAVQFDICWFHSDKIDPIILILAGITCYCALSNIYMSCTMNVSYNA